MLFRTVGMFLVLAWVATTATTATAAIEELKPINDGSSWGATRKLKEAPREVVVSQFNVTFLTTRVAGASAGFGTGKTKVAMRAELPLTNATAQAISDKAYDYFKEALAARGYAPAVHDLETIKATKTWAKYSRKNDDASAGAGSVVATTSENRVDERLAAHATGVAGAYLGRDPGAGYKGYTDLAMELGGKDGKVTASIVAVIDFTKPVEDGYSAFGVNTASVSFAHGLQLVDVPQFGGQPSLNYHSSSAVGGKVWGGHHWASNNDLWLTGLDRVNDGQLVYQIDEARFEEASLELLKPFLDQLAERIDLTMTNGK